MALLADGKTLVVANAGISTHLESGRAKLNLATMAPSLTYLDADSGVLLERHFLDPGLHQLSIRHLALHGDVVAFAMQYQGPRGDVVPRGGVHRRGEPVRLCHAPRQISRRMRHYCGGVSIDKSGSTLAVTCPRGGVVVYWDLATLAYLGHWQLADVSGIAPGGGPGVFLLTAGGGEIVTVSTQAGAVASLSRPSSGQRWDNHLVRIGV